MIAFKSKRKIHGIVLKINYINTEKHLKLININTEMHLKSKHENRIALKSKPKNKHRNPLKINIK